MFCVNKGLPGSFGKRGFGEKFVLYIFYGNIKGIDKVTDHYAIIPTMEIAKSDLVALPETERKILSLFATAYCVSQRKSGQSNWRKG